MSERRGWGLFSAGAAIAVGAVTLFFSFPWKSPPAAPPTTSGVSVTVGPDGRIVSSVPYSGVGPPAAPASPTPGKPEPTARAAVPGTTTRWYEKRREGKKLGWLRVVWAPSTWEGKPTVHDTTTEHTSEGRDMLGTQDVFENETVSDVERGTDGALYWMKSVTTENGGRVSTGETRWVGDGYEHVSRLNGVEERHRVKAATPAHVDAEAFLGARIAAKGVKPGETFTLRQVDVLGERVLEHPVVVAGVEDAPGPTGPVSCTKLVETDPETGGTSTLWVDPEGAVARVKIMTIEIVRVPEVQALEAPVNTASFSITTPASPPIQRIFTAERTLLDVHLRPDPDRPLPDFPASPWSHVTSVDGDDAKGWVVHAELRAYDTPDAKATIPVKDPAFAKFLEPTLLMPCGHPDVQKAAREAVGDETDARKAAQKIADFVYTLEKESPAVAQASAVEILQEMKGDCSEHALLFVALCRAAGIPARRCSGFVCVGPAWGAHAWAEIWTGAWIGVDPTTNDVGTAARYLFYGYDDTPSSHAGMVSARATGRMRLVVTRVEEGDDKFDVGDASTWRIVDNEAGRARHLLAGLEFRDLPKDWKLSMAGDASAMLRVPKGRIQIRAMADQGQRTPSHWRRQLGEGDDVVFAGAPGVRTEAEGRRFYVIGSRRRIVTIDVSVPADQIDAVCAQLEKVMAATFTPRPKAP